MGCVHTRHCCVLHGCKYNDDCCPVASGNVKQEFVCESCSMDDGIESLKELDSFLLLGITDNTLFIKALDIGLSNINKYLEEDNNNDDYIKMKNYLDIIKLKIVREERQATSDFEWNQSIYNARKAAREFGSEDNLTGEY